MPLDNKHNNQGLYTNMAQAICNCISSLFSCCEDNAPQQTNNSASYEESLLDQHDNKNGHKHSLTPENSTALFLSLR